MAALFSVDHAPPRLRAWIGQCAVRVERELEACLAMPTEDVGRLFEAMRYAALGPGKRLRPAVVMAACRDLGGDDETADRAAAAVEMLHAYTLIHDDLPAMDNDDIRRGRPTVHVAFGEATAILAGDALLTEAFAALAGLGARAGQAVAILARLAGAKHLLAGQAFDLAAQRQGARLSLDDLQRLHAQKTGALFAAAAALGGVCASATPEVCHGLEQFGNAFGIAFQYADDLDDGEHAHLEHDARRRMGETASAAQRHAARLTPGGLLDDLGQWALTLK